VELTNFLIVIGIFFAWGLGSFFAKLAANRIGAQGVFWEMFGYIPMILAYSLITFKLRNLLQSDRGGMVLAALAGMLGSFGGAGLYFLLGKTEVSTIIPLTALYPALTVFLGIAFLQESITFTKLLGIFLSLIAIYLLSR
jgi:transporter family protein